MSNEEIFVWKDMADLELVQEAEKGFRGQGAPVEMMHRLKNSLVTQQEITPALTERIRKLNVGLVVFTVALLVVGVVQIVLMVVKR